MSSKKFHSFGSPNRIVKFEFSLFPHSAKERFQLLNVESDERINVQSNGNILWMTPFVFRTICTLDVTYFPFDEQQCEFEVGSWAYTGDVLHVAHKKPQGDLSQLSKNSEWHVISEYLVIWFPGKYVKGRNFRERNLKKPEIFYTNFCEWTEMGNFA